MEEKEIIKLIRKQLIKLGFKKHCTGFIFWTEAILKRIENNAPDKLFMNNVYLDIADRHNATYKRVERAMRYVIDENKELLDYYNLNYKISNSAFLALMTDEMLQILEDIRNSSDSRGTGVFVESAV